MNEQTILLTLRDLKNDLARADWTARLESAEFEQIESQYNSCVLKLVELNTRVYGGLPTYLPPDGQKRQIGLLEKRSLKNQIDQVIQLITIFNPDKKNGHDQ